MIDDRNGPACILGTAPSPLPGDPQIAMAYVPYQQFTTIYSAEKALENGTVFPELNKPFTGERGDVG